MELICDSCGKRWEMEPNFWRCACGAPLRWDLKVYFDLAAIEERNWSIWRYRAMLKLPENAQTVSLGEGATPLIPTPEKQSWLKLEFLNPTGSFKDRGASVLVTGLKAWGISEVAEDSSGNAGVALSAYAKVSGIDCRIFVPKGASEGKIVALQRFGAQIVFCSNRQEAAEQVMIAVQSGIYYASHTWHPLYLQGTKTVAYELAEQLDWIIDENWSVFIPVGNGDLLLGIHLGFQELVFSKVIKRLPRLIGVQALACAPIYAAVHNLTLPFNRTVAEGVAVTDPPRIRQIIAAVRETDGDIVAVSEPSILNAVDELAGLGFWVEPTGAISWAAWNQLGKPPKSILILTGAGWKTLKP
ncbi:MAG: pyridoxal-phosphate dependent enzyme [Armatimonadetes bacterium]|nr:pyridoxal-phosphate dependent enzyme [Armatimonadota bacterium]MDW8029883.1 pyridoxal-phosphate dependent enzyme [Armatimonadota bacterium]